MYSHGLVSLILDSDSPYFFEKTSFFLLLFLKRIPCNKTSSSSSSTNSSSHDTPVVLDPSLQITFHLLMTKSSFITRIHMHCIVHMDIGINKEEEEVNSLKSYTGAVRSYWS